MVIRKSEEGFSYKVYLEVGFKNLSHFSTAFKKEFGVNPSVLLFRESINRDELPKL